MTIRVAGLEGHPMLAWLELPSGVELVEGDAELLVRGVAEEAELDERPSLRAVIIPWAGVPARTRERVAARPPMALHNLHHNAAPTAETAMALLLAAAKRVVPFDRTLRGGDWSMRYETSTDPLLEGGRALILGYGAIGERLARACLGFGMQVRAIRHAPRGDEAVPCTTMDRLDEELDGLTALLVALPWTPETEGLLDADRLARLPDGCCVVNVGRGPIIDERALYEELASGRLRAGLDVWYHYPMSEEERGDKPPSKFDFGALDTVVMSPHRAGHCRDIDALRARDLQELLAAAAEGRPMPGRVSLERGY
ncbi:MAG: NAD(P)-dependent oxidoreductase [Planctomycetota bacterium]